MYYKICSLLVLETLFFVSYSLPTEENSKFLGASNQNQLKLEERKLGDRRKKPTNQGPCNFGYRRNPKSNDIASGRTFFDLQYYNIEHNFNYNINCGGQGGGGYEPFQGGAFGGHKPIIDHKPVTEHGGIKPGGGGLNLGGHHKPHKPSGGGHFQGGNGGGFLENRPVLSNWLANRPLQGLFSQSQSQSQSQADNHHHHNTHNLPPGQYLTISNPHLGSYTSQDLTPVLDQFKPNKIWGLWQQGVHDLVEEFLY